MKSKLELTEARMLKKAPKRTRKPENYWSFFVFWNIFIRFPFPARNKKLDEGQEKAGKKAKNVCAKATPDFFLTPLRSDDKALAAFSVICHFSYGDKKCTTGGQEMAKFKWWHLEKVILMIFLFILWPIYTWRRICQRIVDEYSTKNFSSPAKNSWLKFQLILIFFEKAIHKP